VIIACHVIGIANFKSKLGIMLTILDFQVIPNLFLEITELDSKVMFEVFPGWSYLGRWLEAGELRCHGFHRCHIVIHLFDGQTIEVMYESCCCCCLIT